MFLTQSAIPHVNDYHGRLSIDLPLFPCGGRATTIKQNLEKWDIVFLNLLKFNILLEIGHYLGGGRAGANWAGMATNFTE